MKLAILLSIFFAVCHGKSPTLTEKFSGRMSSKAGVVADISINATAIFKVNMKVRKLPCSGQPCNNFTIDNYTEEVALEEMHGKESSTIGTEHPSLNADTDETVEEQSYSTVEQQSSTVAETVPPSSSTVTPQVITTMLKDSDGSVNEVMEKVTSIKESETIIKSNIGVLNETDGENDARDEASLKFVNMRNSGSPITRSRKLEVAKYSPEFQPGNLDDENSQISVDKKEERFLNDAGVESKGNLLNATVKTATDFPNKSVSNQQPPDSLASNLSMSKKPEPVTTEANGTNDTARNGRSLQGHIGTVEMNNPNSPGKHSKRSFENQLMYRRDCPCAKAMQYGILEHDHSDNGKDKVPIERSDSYAEKKTANFDPDEADMEPFIEEVDNLEETLNEMASKQQETRRNDPLQEGVPVGSGYRLAIQLPDSLQRRQDNVFYVTETIPTGQHKFVNKFKTLGKNLVDVMIAAKAREATTPKSDEASASAVPAAGVPPNNIPEVNSSFYRVNQPQVPDIRLPNVTDSKDASWSSNGIPEIPVNLAPNSGTNGIPEIPFNPAPISGTNGIPEIPFNPVPISGTNGIPEILVNPAPISGTNGISEIPVNPAPILGTNGISEIPVNPAPILGTNRISEIPVNTAPNSGTNGIPEIPVNPAPISGTNGISDILPNSGSNEQVGTTKQQSLPYQLTNDTSQQKKLQREFSLEYPNNEKHLYMLVPRNTRSETSRQSSTKDSTVKRDERGQIGVTEEKVKRRSNFKDSHSTPVKESHFFNKRLVPEKKVSLRASMESHQSPYVKKLLRSLDKEEDSDSQYDDKMMSVNKRNTEQDWNPNTVENGKLKSRDVGETMYEPLGDDLDDTYVDFDDTQEDADTQPVMMVRKRAGDGLTSRLNNDKSHRKLRNLNFERKRGIKVPHNGVRHEEKSLAEGKTSMRRRSATRVGIQPVKWKSPIYSFVNHEIP